MTEYIAPSQVSRRRHRYHIWLWPAWVYSCWSRLAHRRTAQRQGWKLICSNCHARTQTCVESWKISCALGTWGSLGRLIYCCGRLGILLVSVGVARARGLRHRLAVGLDLLSVWRGRSPTRYCGQVTDKYLLCISLIGRHLLRGFQWVALYQLSSFHLLHLCHL